MVQKKRCIGAGKFCLLGLVTAAAVVSAVWFLSFVSLADSTGTVTADSAKIREKADTSSDVIGSAARGKTVSIRNEVQDASGMVWYEVYIDANTTGYIRSDLVEKNGGGQTASQGNTQPESSASGASVDPGTFIDAQYAAVIPETIKVRTAPSTSEAVVDRLTKDAQVIVSGQSDGNDGKLWYYVTFTGTDNAERTGYIRSDLLSLGEMVPVPEEEIPEPEPQEPEPENAEPVNNDYKLTCEPGPDGVDVWYLIDYTNSDGSNTSKKYPVEQLMEVTRARSESDVANAKTLVRQRVAIIVLIVLLVIAIALIVIMALKLRDVYYEEYEDEDEEEQEETPVQRRRRAEESGDTSARSRRRAEESGDTSARSRRRAEESGDTSARSRRRAEESREASGQRRRRAEESEETLARRRRRTEEAEDDTDRTVRRRPERDERRSSVREIEYRDDEAGQAAVNTSPKRKTKNFLLDDDEFEFEFLNMDDKDL